MLQRSNYCQLIILFDFKTKKEKWFLKRIGCSDDFFLLKSNFINKLKFIRKTKKKTFRLSECFALVKRFVLDNPRLTPVVLPTPGRAF